MAEPSKNSTFQGGIKRSPRDSRLWKYLPVSLVVVGGLALSFLLAVRVKNWETEKLKISFEQLADERFHVLESGIQDQLQILDSLGAFFVGSKEVERSEFQTFANYLLKEDSVIKALEWLPRVPASQREVFEAAVKKEGFSNFQITEQTPDGQLIRAGVREEYFPVYYLESTKGYEMALGYDPTSNPARREALSKACDTGKITITGRIRLLDELAGQVGLMMTLPVYHNGMPHNNVEERRNNLMGFVLGILRISDSIKHILEDLSPAAINVYLYDESAPSQERFLFYHPSSPSKTVLTSEMKGPIKPSEKEFQYSKSFEVAGRQWQMICTPPPDYFKMGIDSQAWKTLTLGLLLTAFLTAYFISNITRTKRIEHLVEQRTTEIRDAQEGLKKLASIMEYSNDAIISETPEGIILSWNAAAEKMLGYSAEEVIGRSAEVLFSPDDRKELLKALEKIKQGEFIKNFETTRVGKDGKRIDVSVSLSPIKNVHGQVVGVSVVARDITERKQVREVLRESEEKFRKIAASAQDAIIMIDPEGCIAFWNKAAERIFGYLSEEAMGKDVHLFLAPPRYHGAYKESFEKFKVTGQGPIVGRVRELEAIRKDGKEISIELSVAAVKVKDRWNSIGVIRDITERKQVEEKLVRLSTAIEQATEVIVITDTEGNIQYVNPSFERVTGYTRAEVIGKNPKVLKSGKQDAAFYRQLWNTIKGGKVWTGHFINKKKDGTLFEEDASISPVFDQSGNIFSFVGVKRDVTRQVEMEKELRQSQKMEAVGRLAGGIAHDFNNILAAMVGFARLASAELPESSSVRNDLEQVIKAGNRGKDLISRIMAFSRQSLTSGIKGPCQLVDVVQETMKLLRPAIPSSVQFEFHLPPDLPVIIADMSQLHQVLVNLCVNASEAMPDGGILTLSLDVEDLTKEEGDKMVVPGQKHFISGKYVVLSVRDTGQGIAKEVLPKIFDPFFTTKKMGTGMGLAVVYGIVKGHEGMIRVFSEVGKGTTMKVYFPAAKPGAAKEGFPKANVVVQGGNESILVVDDEEMVATVITRLLEEMGYKVSMQTDSSKALKFFKEKPSDFDLVILDQIMPGLTGDKLAEEITRLRPGMPIIMCTGFSNVLSDERMKEVGIHKILIKPILGTLLEEEVRKLLNERRATSTPNNKG